MEKTEQQLLEKELDGIFREAWGLKRLNPGSPDLAPLKAREAEIRGILQEIDEDRMKLPEAFERMQNGTPPREKPKTEEEAIARDVLEDMQGVRGSELTPTARIRMAEVLANMAAKQKSSAGSG